MAQTGYTPISLYYSATGAAVPTAGNLVAGELALNTNDGKLFYKNSSGVVTLLAGATAGPAGGSTTQIQYNNSGVLAGSAAMVFNSGTSTVTLTTLNLTNALPVLSGGTGVTTSTGTGSNVLSASPTLTGTVAAASLSLSSLTSGRVTYAGTAGLLQDSANLTFSGTALAVTGSLGVGGAANAGIGLYVQNAALTGTSQYAIYAQAIATSASTTAIYGALLQPRTAAASFTVANSYGLFLPDAVKGAGSAITNQYALYIEDQVQGTSNFGIRSVVSSGTNKYNLYISGTAINYFAGNAFFGKTASALATAGIELQAVGFLAVTRAERPFVLNRLTTDGDLIELYRDSVSKATIGITTSDLTFGVGGAEKMRLTSVGDFIVGNTTPGALGTTIYNAAANGNVGRVDIVKTASGAATAMTFRHIATAVGSISYTDVATTYNTSSDSRLKENIQNAPDAAELIDAIQVRQFNWKAGGSHQRYGFIAQELVTVAPEAVYTPTDPDEMMAVDYSKLVPMLVKELQSLRARVAQLESKP